MLLQGKKSWICFTEKAPFRQKFLELHLLDMWRPQLRRLGNFAGMPPEDNRAGGVHHVLLQEKGSNSRRDRSHLDVRGAPDPPSPYHSAR